MFKEGSISWHGKINNAYVPAGTYYWLVTATDNNGHEMK